MSKKKLTYIGRDDWSRPLYRDENGRIWVDVDPRSNIPLVSVPSPTPESPATPCGLILRPSLCPGVTCGIRGGRAWK